MDILQKTFREVKDVNFKDVFKNCLFVFDTNTLLDLYRLPTETSDDLKRILADDQVNSRIWMPFQVYLEFSHNRLSTIKAQKATFLKVIELFKEKIRDLESFEKSIDNKLASFELQKRHSVMKVENYKLNANFDESVQKLKSFIEDTEALSKNQPDYEKDDTIYKKIAELFTDKIGEPFASNELKAIYKEADERFSKNIPPGFEDAKSKEFNADKPEEYSYRFGKQEFIRKYGDLVAWKEILKKAKQSDSKYVVFVCNEKKPDWWQLDAKKKVKPRYELLNEIYSECPNLEFFTIFEVHQFLKQMTETYDNFAVKDESIKAAKEVSQAPTKTIKEISRDFVERRTYTPDKTLSSHQNYFYNLLNKIVGEYRDSRYNGWRLNVEISRDIYPPDKDVQFGLFEIISFLFSSFKTSLVSDRELTISETASSISFEFKIPEKHQIMLKLMGNITSFMNGYYSEFDMNNPFFMSYDPQTYTLKIELSKEFFTENSSLVSNEAKYYVYGGELFNFEKE